MLLESKRSENKRKKITTSGTKTNITNESTLLELYKVAGENSIKKFNDVVHRFPLRNSYLNPRFSISRSHYKRRYFIWLQILEMKRL